MARHLVSAGINAKVVFLYRKRGTFDGDPNIEVLYPCKPSLWGYLKIVVRLVMLVRRSRPDAIIGMAHYSSPLATLSGWLAGVPRRIATQTSQPSRLNKFARGLDWMCGTFGIYTSNVSASKSIERAFDQFPLAYRSRLKTIYNGVSVQPVSLTKAQAREEFGLDPTAFLLVTCGRLAAVKNHELLLKVIERTPNVHLAILGEGELRHSIEESVAAKSIGSRVTLLGEVPPDRVPRFLRAGDVFVFPSHSEAFGMAAAEAMMAGLPIIGSNYPSIAEVIGDAGPLLDAMDVDGWMSAVKLFISNRAALADSSAKSLEQGGKFTIEAMVSSYCEEFFGGQQK